MKKLGTGGGDSKLVHPGIRTGSPAKATITLRCGQIGAIRSFQKRER